MAALLLVSGCISPQVKLFTDATEPLQEFTIQGKGKAKILLIPVRGIITDAPGKQFLRSAPNMVQEIVSQLGKARKDDDIKAVILKINSPGGTVTASDILYHEIMAFKEETGVKIVAAMMDVAASGGYYISLPADLIMAHPTTITGSVGVIFMRPKLEGLMEKIGLGVEVNKSAKNKDMGSPFRPTTGEEQKILDGLVRELGQRFLHLVATHRKPGQEALAQISTARICLADDAKGLGLVDEIGYLSDAISKAKSLAGLSERAKVVVYRRTKYPDDNLYNISMTKGGPLSLMAPGLSQILTSLQAGFHYLWPAAVE